MNLLKNRPYWSIVFLFVVVVLFFKPFFAQGQLPIPSDTIIGLYHPFRDLYAKNYPNGIPYKNFLITDPVRQQYPWRELAIDILKKYQLPLWNPYQMAGYPLLGNLQSAIFYPLNVFFLFLPFSWSWSILLLLQPLLGGTFLYFYLRNVDTKKEAAILGSIVFAFSGFSIAWMEWGTILHAGLWLPLALLAIDKILFYFNDRKKTPFLWIFIFIFSLTLSLFAGHLQTSFYVLLLSLIYLFIQWWRSGKNLKVLVLFICSYFAVSIITAVQWIPALQLILQSARDIDQGNNWQQAGWFIPWQHLIQFIAPDFYGNPATLNYWGVWNYGELVGYVGIVPLVFGLFAIFSRRDKKTIFYSGVLFVSLLFSLPTGISALPFVLHIPFLSTAQPTRLLFLVDFSLALLAAFGLDSFLKEKKKTIFYPLILLSLVLVALWVIVYIFAPNWGISRENLLIAKSNLRLPTLLFGITTFTFIVLHFLRGKKVVFAFSTIIIVLTVFDLLRFGWKFTPFTNKTYLFPKTKAIEFLEKQNGQFRIMTTDNRILPPNFSTIYRLQSIDGYDPLYLRRYGELIAASERGKPDITAPFGFNRIITPHNSNSKIIDLLGVKYVLSLTDIDSKKLEKVFEEGQTRIYENKSAMPRAFFVENVTVVNNKEEAIKMMYDAGFDLQKSAVVEKQDVVKDELAGAFSVGKVNAIFYAENKIKLDISVKDAGFLILTDSYYPTWHVFVDGKERKLYRVDYVFRGVIVPSGNHIVEFKDTLF